MVVKTAEEAKLNYEASVAYVPSRYAAGVQRADWLGPAKSDAAEKNYADAVTRAASTKARQKAIASMSNEDWKNAAVTKGAPIIAERMRASSDKWKANFEPIYGQVVSKVAAFPPPTLDFRANITNRLVPVVETWKKAAGKI